MIVRIIRVLLASTVVIFSVTAISAMAPGSSTATMSKPDVQQGSAESGERIRIVNIFDAFGEVSEGVQLSWGFSAYIEYRGQTILFDGGGNPEILSQNARALSIDLTKVDFAILSHRHPDHAAGARE